MATRRRAVNPRPQAIMRQLSELLQAFVDILIPGDSLFPAASQVGVHQSLAERVRAHHEGGIDKLAGMLARGEKPFTALSPQQRIGAVRRFERADPEFFNFVLATVYFAYYQHPLVVRAIRQLGHEYNDAPQPRGYLMPAFDPQLDAPKHSRGYYKRTHEVVPVDTSVLETLLKDLPRYSSAEKKGHE